MKKQKPTKTIEQYQAAIDRSYRTMFLLISICLLLFIAFTIQILSYAA